MRYTVNGTQVVVKLSSTGEDHIVATCHNESWADKIAELLNEDYDKPTDGRPQVGEQWFIRYTERRAALPTAGQVVGACVRFGYADLPQRVADQIHETTGSEYVDMWRVEVLDGDEGQMTNEDTFHFCYDDDGDPKRCKHGLSISHDGCKIQ